MKHPPAVPSTPSLPERLARRETSHRSFAPSGALGAGFLHKPDSRDDVIDAVGDMYVLVYLLRGSGRYLDRQSGTIPVRAGDVVQRLPGRRHSTLTDPGSGWVEFYIVLPRSLFVGLSQCAALPAETPVIHAGVDLALVARMERFLADLARCRADQGSLLVGQAVGLVCEVMTLHGQLRSQDRLGQAVGRACRQLVQRLDRRPSQRRLAAEVGLGYEQFRKVFRQRIGSSPGAWLIRQRIDAARSLLLQDADSLATIATRLGYPDVYSFSKQFSAVVGMSPGRYRRCLGAGA